MEWVEITGRTVEEAKDAALDQLGVDTVDAEFEILEEPSRGLFGKMKGQARVRARIAPTSPRPKVERRDRRKKGSGNGGGRTQSQRPATPAADETPAAPASNGKRPDRRRGAQKAAPTEKENTTVTETVDVDLAEHTRIVTEFLDGLVDAFDLEGRVEAVSIDDDTSEVRVDGRDLGILVGPKGNTLAASQVNRLHNEWHTRHLCMINRRRPIIECNSARIAQLQRITQLAKLTFQMDRARSFRRVVTR